jgi:HK97 gp10 family phage protein
MWVDEVKSRVPVLEGDLKESIHSFVRTRKASDKTEGLPTGSVTVGPAYGTPRSDGRHSVPPAVYGMWVEFGVKSKSRYPKQPFMRPAFDATAEKAVKLFSDTLKEALEEIAKE